MKTIFTITAVLLSGTVAVWSDSAAGWASANRAGGSTSHSYGSTSHENRYGGSSTHEAGEGTEHTNAYGGSTAHARQPARQPGFHQHRAHEAHAGRDLEDAVQQHEHADRQAQQQLAGVRQLQLGLAPAEQDRAEFGLKQRDLPADCRLLDVQSRGRSGEA